LVVSNRAVINRDHPLLKTKFRRVKYLDVSDFELANKMIAAACVLHNFIIIGDRVFPEDENYSYEIDANVEEQQNDIVMDEENYDAIEKRRRIAEEL
ncbi:hypothetical protein ALC57_03079, partial [Trachymyrmex cornetzi]